VGIERERNEYGQRRRVVVKRLTFGVTEVYCNGPQSPTITIFLMFKVRVLYYLNTKLISINIFFLLNYKII